MYIKITASSSRPKLLRLAPLIVYTMSKRKYLIVLVVVLLIGSVGAVYYQHQQKQANAYKTVSEVDTDELVSNTLDASILTVEQIEPTTTQKDLSKFEKQVTNKHTIYHYNESTDIHLQIEYSSIRVDSKRQEGQSYEVQAQEFLSTTGEVQQYQFTTTLSGSEQRVDVDDKLEAKIQESVNSEITQIESVSLIDNLTKYRLENDSTITVNSNGIITQIEMGSTEIHVTQNGEEPTVPQIESEILEENITEEE